MQAIGDSIIGSGKKLLLLTAAITGIGVAATKITAHFDAQMSMSSLSPAQRERSLMSFWQRLWSCGARLAFLHLGIELAINLLKNR